MNNNAIGIFDSGVGGLSIWKEITEILPNENTIYLADSKNAPYGEKTKEEIVNLCIKNTEKLLQLGCKIIVVACNTATTNAIQILRSSYNVPFIGIEPAIKPASLQTKTNTIGILATKGTLNSSLFAETTQKYIKDDVQIIERVGTGLVPLVESNQINTIQTRLLLEEYLNPMLDKKIDCLVLGCTHYPFLIPIIRTITGTSVKIIDSGLAVAKQTQAVINSKGLTNNSSDTAYHQLYTNTDLKTMTTLINIINVKFIREDF